MLKTFLEYVQENTFEVRRKLEIIARTLEENKFKVKRFLDVDENPYIFVYSSARNDFDGVRIYSIGDIIAYRVQNEESTEPYGKSYLLDLDKMYQDVLSDDRIEEKKAAAKVSQEIAAKLDSFFKKSALASSEKFTNDGDPPGNIMMSVGGNDYYDKLMSRPMLNI